MTVRNETKKLIIFGGRLHPAPLPEIFENSTMLHFAVMTVKGRVGFENNLSWKWQRLGKKNTVVVESLLIVKHNQIQIIVHEGMRKLWSAGFAISAGVRIETSKRFVK